MIAIIHISLPQCLYMINRYEDQSVHFDGGCLIKNRSGINTVALIDMFLEESKENCNLYIQYCEWCVANGYESVGTRRFQKLINEEILLGERQLYSAKKDMLVNDGKWNYLKHNIYEEGRRYLLDINGSTEEVIRKDRVWFFNSWG